MLHKNALQNSVVYKAFIPALMGLQANDNLAEALLQAVGWLGSCLCHIHLGSVQMGSS